MSYEAMCPECGAVNEYPNRPGEYAFSPMKQLCDQCQSLIDQEETNAA